MPNFAQYYKRIIARLGYQKIVPKGITRENFFDLYFSLRQPFVVQLGANDGMTHDPIYKYISKYKLLGLLVEPQPDAYQRLKNNHTDNPNLAFANVAIGDTEGAMPFYRIRPELVMEGREYKASSGSSFYRNDVIKNVKNRLPPIRNNILKQIPGTPEDYVQEIQVKVTTPNNLFSSYGIEKIDFLLIDCQGADYAILKNFDFKRFSPDIINYEHSLLGAEDLKESRLLLESHGYKYFIHEGDTCAYKV